MFKPDTLTIRVGCQFDYAAADDTPAICLVRPSGLNGVRLIKEAWTTTPAVPYHDYVDIFDNVCRRLTLPAGRATIHYDAQVETSLDADEADPAAEQLPVEALPDGVLVYTLPSRFCLSDELYDRAAQLFGMTKPDWTRVQAISQYVHDHVRFGYEFAAPTRSSSDVLAQSTGVCRDFTHLGIAFCRAMSIPARYVFGYIPDIDVPAIDAPMDFCAWFEAYLGGAWWTFDPRNNERRRGRVIIGRGRDAADVPMVTTYGPATFQGMTCWAEQIPSGIYVSTAAHDDAAVRDPLQSTSSGA
jgi:transglutaminase-like putative cysteine protease